MRTDGGKVIRSLVREVIEDTLAGFNSAHNTDHPEDKQIYLKDIGYNEFKGFLKMIRNRRAAKEFLLQFFDVVGAGDFRAVFLISDKSVIKLAQNEGGIQDNLAEIRLNQSLAPFAPMMIDHDPNGLWVEFEFIPSEYRGAETMERMTGISGGFLDTISHWVGDYVGEDYEFVKGEERKWVENMLNNGADEDVLRGLVNKIIQYQITDLHSDNVGYSPRTKIPILLDYGAVK